jgi:glycosyltransferase involved in cell wall biosynthesis
MTKRAIECLSEKATDLIEVIIIDNASEIDYVSWWVENGYPNIIPTVVINPILGLPESLKRGLEVANGDIIVFMHNDVLIHEPGWDEIIEAAFRDNIRLGMAGFFGASGIDWNGARINPVSMMLGLEWGGKAEEHGAIITDITPACIFDSLCLIFRREYLDDVGIPDDVPIFHWHDRIMTLMFINKGYHCAVLPIGFDHFGGGTSSSEIYNQRALLWLKENDIEIYPDEAPDVSVYMEGLRIFNRDWSWKLPLTVDKNYNYYWSSQ